MKKRLFSLFVTISMLLAMLPAIPASAYVFTLGQPETIYAGETRYYEFTPTESGVYRFRLQFYDAPPMFEVTDRNSYFVNYITSYNDSPNPSNMIENYLLVMQKGEYYQIRIETDPMSSSNVKFTPSKYTVSPKAELTVGKTLTCTPTSRPYIVKFVPEKSGDIAVDISSLDHGYDSCWESETGTEYYSDDFAVRQRQYNFRATAGNTYYFNLGDTLEQNPYTLNAQWLDAADNTTVETSDIDDMQSGHYYSNNMDKKWVYTAPEGTMYSDIVFSKDSKLTAGDYIYIYDENNNQVFYGYDDAIAGKTVSALGSKFTIHLKTDENYVGYGFSLDDIISHESLAPPVADIKSGTIRPDYVTLFHGLADVYYKLEGVTSTTDFVKYTEPILISEDSTLYTYAQYDGQTSETVSYNYKMNPTPIAPPQFTEGWKGSTYQRLALSAPEGTIYYKRMLSDSDYTKYYSSDVRLDNNDIMAAYTMVDQQKSEVVYYSMLPEESTDTAAPTLVVTDILGGKKVSFVPPKDYDLYQIIENDNYVVAHPTYYHSHFEGYGNNEDHAEGNTFSYLRDESYICVTASGETTKKKTTNLYDEATASIELFEDTALKANTGYKYEKKVGTWYYDDWSDSLFKYHKHRYTVNETNSSASQSFAYKYIEIPKATAPTIYYGGTSAVIVAEEGLKIYYQINYGDFQEYTGPIELSEGDSVKAYTIGMGLAKSDIVYQGLATDSAAQKIRVSINNDILGSAPYVVPIKIESYFGSEDATLVRTVFDNSTGKLEKVQIDEVTLKQGANTTFVSAIGLSDECKEPYAGIYLWDSMASMKPLCEFKKFPVRTE